MTVVFSRVFILFAIIFLGFYIGKRKIMRSDVAPDVSNLVIKVTMPVTVFLSMLQPVNSELIQESILMAVAAAIFHTLTMLLGFVFVAVCKVPKRQRGIWLFVCMFSNNGFMGFPLALAVFGQKGMLLMAFANTVSNLLMFSLGTKMLTRYYDVKSAVNVRSMLFTNLNIAVAIGMVFLIGQIPIPQLASDLLNYIGNITAGLSMIVVGLSLSRISLKSVFKGKDVWILSAVRLLLVPLLTFAVVKLIPGAADMTMMKVLVMMAALPAASSVSIISEQYGTDTELPAKAVFVSTLISVVTVPVIMGLVY